MEPLRLVPWREGDRRYIVPMIALAFVLGLLVATFYIVFTVVRIDGHSMAPTLLHADRALITKGYPRPAHGDIVSIVDIVEGHEIDYLKRVIGVPGDKVVYRGDVAYVNGAPSTAAPGALIQSEEPAGSEFIVPDGHVVVLGDNRPKSMDSRFIGPVPISEIQGKAVAIILPLTRFRVIDDGRATP